MENLFKLDGKVAIVTGAGSGLGEAMAHALAKAGASVAVAAHKLSDAQQVTADIQSLGGKAIPIGVDVGDSASVEEMVKETLGSLGTIDILVNNAGINRRGPCVSMAEEDWDEVIRVNLKGAWLCSRAVGPVLLEKKKGKVINIASTMGAVALPERAPYASSKGAMIQLTKTLALEWAKYNINVNAIGPGYFLTKLNRRLMDDPAVFNELTSRIPMGRWAEPEEIGGPVVFLASDASNYMTGQVLFVEGGYLSW
ncbi:MAG: 3-oxoacyl-ACP reductase FabG [Firmicutes bacterium]|nr:3-oxoacyl-ACP reductase FabG [Bacillota bacterium]